MNIISELRSIQQQVIILEGNQKEVVSPYRVAASGAPITHVDASTRIGLLIMSVENLIHQLLTTQQKLIEARESY